MKYLLLILLCLSGCASNPITVDVHKVQASADIMKDCEEFTEPTDGSLSAFAKALFENKKSYVICNSQNKAKKEFIIKQY